MEVLSVWCVCMMDGVLLSECGVLKSNMRCVGSKLRGCELCVCVYGSGGVLGVF